LRVQVGRLADRIRKSFNRKPREGRKENL